MLGLISVLSQADVYGDIQDLSKRINDKESKEKQSINFIPNIQNYAIEPEWITQRKSVENELKQIAQTYNLDVPELDDTKNLCENGLKASTYIFVSQSMPSAVLRGILQKYYDQPDVQIVTRGVLPGENYMNNRLSWARIADGDEKLADVLMDPRPFEKLNITQVPAIAIVDQNGTAVLKGSSNIDFLRKKIDQEGFNDFGVYGNVYEISEIDFVKDMQERMSKIDIRKEIKGAQDRFWTKYEYVNLPDVDIESNYIVDISRVVTKDITIRTGAVVAKKGDVINPLKMLTITKAYVILDFTKPGHVESVKAAVRKLKEERPNITPVYMITHFAKGEEMNTYSNAMKVLRGKVYLLTPEVVNAFKLNSLPVVVTQIGDVLNVQKIKPVI